MQMTGYTSFIIKDGMTSAYDFVKLCLRGFGILCAYRDEPLSPNIPKTLKKETYHEKELAKAKEKLERLRARTDDEWVKEIETEIDAATIRHEKEAAENAEALERLTKVKNAIQEWDCDEKYLPVKKFALEQISSSEPVEDTWHARYVDSLKTALASQEGLDAYKNNLINLAVEDIQYHTEHMIEDEERWHENQEYLDGFWKEVEKLNK